MRGHMSAKADDKAITTRLVPDIVVASGGITPKDKLMPVSFTDTSYTLLYRICGNHQKQKFQNKNMGYLEIKKKLIGDTVDFNIKKTLVNYDNLNLHLDACLNVKNDNFNTPLDFYYMVWSYPLGRGCRCRCFPVKMGCLHR